MTQASATGVVKEVRLEWGVIRYRESGPDDGPALLFVHGILANGTLWRDVVPRLSGRFRCVVPDLPLGGHPVALHPETDLSPRGVARILADFMEALDLRDVTLVGNDTGGAICQLVVAEYHERLGRLVLTNCDAYEAFFPKILSPLRHGARLLGERFCGLLAAALRYRAAQRLLFGAVARRRLDDTTLDAYLSSFLGEAGIRRDLTKFLAAVSNRYTLEAARSFPGFRKPVLILWGEDDVFFSSRLAQRLQRDFPDARLEFLPGSRAFVPEDRPGILADRIAGLIGVCRST